MTDITYTHYSWGKSLATGLPAITFYTESGPMPSDAWEIPEGKLTETDRSRIISETLRRTEAPWDWMARMRLRFPWTDGPQAEESAKVVELPAIMTEEHVDQLAKRLCADAHGEGSVDTMVTFWTAMRYSTPTGECTAQIDPDLLVPLWTTYKMLARDAIKWLSELKQ